MTDGNTMIREALDEALLERSPLRLSGTINREVAALHLLREISDQLHMIQESLHRIALNTDYTPERR